MNNSQVEDILIELINLPVEDECIEFKEAKNDFNFEDIGRYFSALCNECNLKNRRYAWLIFGIKDKGRPRDIIGTYYRNSTNTLESLKKEVANGTTGNITFMDIFELNISGKRVIMFQIPPAPKGIPVSWKGHYYGRDGESLGALNLQELELIRSQNVSFDWSAQICEDATIEDLDKEAILKAREQYKIKNPKLSIECDRWSDETFLNKSKLTIKGKITKAAIILLGKEDSEHFISSAVAKITWILKDERNIEKDYEHFGPPFILSVGKVFDKIRNLKYRYLTDNTLFPSEITQYEPFVIREVLNNCIAHQDYSMSGKINVVERQDELVFSNLGSFIPKTIENVINRDAPEEYYRNQFLANAMVNFNMIDTIGSGIKKMFILQMQRYFPLPDYNLSSPDKVIVKIIGKVLDENYTKLLISNTNLELSVVIALDKVQKKEPLSESERNLLRKIKLIEGRYPNIYVTSKIASVTGQKAQYIKNRGFDKEYYKNLIIEYLRQYGSATRQEIEGLVMEKLPDILSDEQKYRKISKILNEMAHVDNTIFNNSGSTKTSNWVLI
jgi:ATP-dependent DNA helicase RecG